MAVHLLTASSGKTCPLVLGCACDPLIEVCRGAVDSFFIEVEIPQLHHLIRLIFFIGRCRDEPVLLRGGSGEGSWYP